jgi:hypothetical protein
VRYELRSKTTWGTQATNLGNFMRTLALPEAVAQWPTSLREKLVKIGQRSCTTLAAW